MLLLKPQGPRLTLQQVPLALAPPQYTVPEVHPEVHRDPPGPQIFSEAKGHHPSDSLLIIALPLPLKP